MMPVTCWPSALLKPSLGPLSAGDFANKSEGVIVEATKDRKQIPRGNKFVCKHLHKLILTSIY